MPICAIESTEPMSMPSSSVVVATTGRRPRPPQACLGFFADLAGETAVVRPELVRQVRPCRLPAEQISEAFHLRSAVGEDQVGATSQGLVEVS